MEQFTYNNNTHIHTISEDFKQILVSRGLPESKIILVYNWIDEQVVVPIEKKDNILISRYGLDPGKFFVTHCGNIGHSQNLEMVVDIAADLEEDLPDLEFVFIGDGTKAELERYIQDKGVGNVRYSLSAIRRYCLCDEPGCIVGVFQTRVGTVHFIKTVEHHVGSSGQLSPHSISTVNYAQLKC